MPDAIEPQLDELRRRARRRLIGAIVLALVAAVVVPMLLESEPRPLGEDLSVKIPAVDDTKFVSKLNEKGRAADSVAAVVSKPAPPPTPSDPPAAVAKPASSGTAPNVSQAVPPPPTKPAAQDAPQAMASDAAKGAKAAANAFSVQLAAFADDKGANALANRLKKSGHAAYTEPYTTPQGTVWRVRVGPYATRDAAEAARTKLKADGQNGIIAAAN